MTREWRVRVSGIPGEDDRIVSANSEEIACEYGMLIKKLHGFTAVVESREVHYGEWADYGRNEEDEL